MFYKNHFYISIIKILMIFISSSANSFSIKPPDIGVYKINYRDQIIHIFSEIPNSQVILSYLKPSYYTETTFQLVCNATIPVQWMYYGIGMPSGIASTSRISVPNKVEFYQATVVFSVMNELQEGFYVCEGIKYANISTFVNIQVVKDIIGGGNINQNLNKYLTIPYKPVETVSNHLRLSFASPTQVKCCSSNLASSLTIRFNKCSSWSDCKLRQAYMENNKNCSQYYGNQNLVVKRVATNQIETCFTFDMIENNYEYNAEDNFISNEFQQGIFQCSSSNANNNVENKYIIFTRGNDNKILTDFNWVQDTNLILQLSIEPSSDEHPEEIFVICNANSFFFSNGIKWAIQDLDLDKQPALNYLEEETGRVLLKLSKRQMTKKKVYCFAPEWNSLNWKNTTTTAISYL